MARGGAASTQARPALEELSPNSGCSFLRDSAKVPRVARPKPDDPVDVAFHVRTTRAEADALALVIRRWGERLAAQGVPIIPDKTTWFRSLVRKLAAEDEIAVNDPPPPAPPAAAKRSAKPRRSGK
jgi:hypothetical protein